VATRRPTVVTSNCPSRACRRPNIKVGVILMANREAAKPFRDEHGIVQEHPFDRRLRQKRF